jgi:HD-GYP domain-containing protein (c-di-GMP phosphodiesterase class II)
MSVTTVMLMGAAWSAVSAYALILAVAARRADTGTVAALARGETPTGSRPLDDGTAALLTALQRHDGATGWHSRRVSLLARRVASLLGLAGGALDDIEEAALVHDAGKLRVPARILRKAGPLTPGEWALVRRHPQWGAELIAGVGQLGRHAPAVQAHHECWAGGGYPRGTSGGGIPLAARIIAACDAYDAMIADRPYAPRRTSDQALLELRACSGRQFDPLVVAALEAALTAEAEPVAALAG